MTRGEIWWSTLSNRDGSGGGSGPRYRRPVLIVQSDSFTDSGINTVVVAVITSNTRLARAPGNVALSMKQSGLLKPAVVNVSQLITIDKSMLTERVHELELSEMAAVNQGLRLVLGPSMMSYLEPVPRGRSKR